MSIQPRPVVVSLALSLLAGGAIAAVIPTDGGATIFLVVVISTALAGLLCGAMAAMFASTRWSAMGTGALTGLLMVGSSWVFGLGAFVATTSSTTFRNHEAQEFADVSVHVAFHYATSSMYRASTLVWLTLVVIAVVLGAVGGVLVELSESKPLTRLPPLFSPLLLAALLTVVAMFFSVSHVQILGMDTPERTFLTRTVLALSYLAPTLAYGWAAAGVGRHCAHPSRGVRRLGWFGAVTLLVFVSASAIVAVRFLPPWAVPFAVVSVAFGGLVGGMFGTLTATGKDTAPRWRDIAVDTCVSVVLLIVLIAGCSGYTPAFGMVSLVIPVFQAVEAGDITDVPSVDVRMADIRHAMLLAIPYSWWGFISLAFASGVGVALQRWLLQPVSPPSPPSHKTVVALETSREGGPFQPPSSG